MNAERIQEEMDAPNSKPQELLNNVEHKQKELELFISKETMAARDE